MTCSGNDVHLFRIIDITCTSIVKDSISIQKSNGATGPSFSINDRSLHGQPKERRLLDLVERERANVSI
jgi:hypothetical protein